MDFFKINGRTIKPPKNIGHSVEILDKVERTLNGTMVVDKVGMKKKIDVSWDYLDVTNMQILQQEIKKESFVNITYFDSEKAEKVTIETKPSDLSYQTGYDWVKGTVIWKSVSLFFKEK